MWTQYYLSILLIFLGSYEFTVLHYYHLPSEFSSKFHHPCQYFMTKMLTREGRILADGWTHSPFMAILVHFFLLRSVIKKSYHGDIRYHMALNLIFSALIPSNCSGSKFGDLLKQIYLYNLNVYHQDSMCSVRSMITKRHFRKREVSNWKWRVFFFIKNNNNKYGK